MRVSDAYRDAAISTDASVRSAQPTDGGAKSTGAVDPTQAPVTVTVSEKARELSSQTAETSDAKVARIQQALTDGSFKVDAAAIAKRIVNGD